MARILFLSPMVPSFDLDKTVEFFCGPLGFELVFSSPTYRICGRDGLTVHFLRAGEDIGQMEFYLEVDDLDSIWERLSAVASEFRHKPPHVRDYGMREIHIGVPHTNCLLFIGQAITSS